MLEYDISTNHKVKEEWKIGDVFVYNEHHAKDNSSVRIISYVNGNCFAVALDDGASFYLDMGYNSVSALMKAEYPDAIKLELLEPIKFKTVGGN